jgi:CheY-like chemotaxis protein
VIPDDVYKVLIANDEPIILAIMKVIFEKCNFVVTAVQNGQMVFDKINSKSKQLDNMYDLVVLDLDMPVCDGYDACKQTI